MRMILSTVVVVVALALAPAAMADSSSVGTYGGQGGEVAGSVASDPGNQASSLPFTGLDVGLMAGGGALLLLIGLTMARAVPRNRDV
jgi:hypothetical protein